jgi:2'-5' RNA ligase
MRPNRVKRALKSGQVQIGAWLNVLRSPQIMRMLKTSGFDFVYIDMEHSCLSMETVGDLCYAALSVDLVPIVRPSAKDAPYLSRPLDNGAMGLLIPHVDTREEAEAVIRDAAVERFKPLAGGVRWVGAEAMHLTLKFIGEIDELAIPGAIEAMQPAAEGAEPFDMRVAGVAGFPPSGKPRVIHVGVEEPSGRLAAIQTAVESALARELGVAPEQRRWTPHITLGRVKDSRRCPRMEQIAAAVPEQDFGTVYVESFVLMASDLRPAGAVYTPVHRFELGDALGG